MKILPKVIRLKSTDYTAGLFEFNFRLVNSAVRPFGSIGGVLQQTRIHLNTFSIPYSLKTKQFLGKMVNKSPLMFNNTICSIACCCCLRV